MMALNATEEPMLMSANKLTMTRLVHNAFKGTLKRGCTFARNEEKGSPLSLAKA